MRIINFGKNLQLISKLIADEIKKGKILVLPTDTVYGLICDATNKKTVESIFKMKQRPRTKPLPIFVKDIKQAKTLAEIDKNQEKLLQKIWPGKVTAVLKSKKKNGKGKIYGTNKDTIALRIPRHKVFSYLFSVINSPLVGTSANISGKPSSCNIKEILEQFSGEKIQPDFVIDSGNLPKRKPSKILDLTVLPPKVLRD